MDHVTLSARVRDNQRRSRARRKEYILELEERVRRFERLGVEATREVQAAGRKVAAENTLLRSLLRHHGVTENNVGEYLRSKTRPDPHPHPSVIAPFNSRVHDPEHKMDPVGGSFSPSNSVIIRHASPLNDQAASADQPSDVDPVIPKASRAPQPGGKQGAGQATSCETAARIISSLRGHSDMQGLRSELGCHSESKCTVKNMDIFEILDK